MSTKSPIKFHKFMQIFVIKFQALIYKKSLTLSPTKSSLGSSTEEARTGDDDDDDDEDGGHSRGDRALDLEDDKQSGTSSTGQTSSTTHGFDNGSIVNIMSEDTNNIMMFFWMAHFIWAIPLKVGKTTMPNTYVR